MRGFMAGLMCIIGVGGCSAPTYRYLGQEAQTVTRGDLDFTVRRKEDSVEVVRTGFVYKPQQVDIAVAMRSAAEEVTGCTMKDGSFSGDVAVGEFKIGRCHSERKP